MPEITYLLNKMVIPRRFRFFCVVVVLLTFGMPSFYRRGVNRRLVAAFYLCPDESNKQGKFDQLKMSNYGCQYVEKLKLQIF